MHQRLVRMRRTGRPVAIVLRAGKTPSGVEVRAHIRRLVRSIRGRWPVTRVIYLFGLTGTRPLTAKVEAIADAVRTRRAVENADRVRDFAETRHKAKGWRRERRAVARIEATKLGLDIRFVVTNLAATSPRLVYETLYCARGQAENLIKAHKTHLASDRTSCRRAVANQVRLVLHTAAYWLLLAVRDAVPAVRDLAKAEFSTLRLRLVKIAVRVQEIISRIRLSYAACHPEADLFQGLVTALAPRPRGAAP